MKPYYLLFIAVLSSLLFIACTDLEDSQDNAARETDYPDQESWQARMLFTKEGKRKATLEAGYIAKFTEKQYTLIREGLRVEFYDEAGNPKSVLTSEEGKVFDNTQDMIATGNVVVVSKNGSTLYTSELNWKNEDERIVSNVPVMITTDTDTIYGDTFRSDPDLVNYEITNTRGSSQTKISIDD